MNKTQKIPRTQRTRTKAFYIRNYQLDFNVCSNIQAHLEQKPLYNWIITNPIKLKKE